MGRHWVSLVFVGLCACAHRGGGAGGPGGGEAGFSIGYPDAANATARLGKRFYAKPVARCNHDDGTEARWTMTGTHVASGELPPGLTLEDGVIGGIPTKAGSYQAHIELLGVMCAGKPYEGQAVDIGITVK